LKKNFCLFIFSLFGLISASQENYYSSPVKIPVLLSGSFAELRNNHFHSGIDIKTNGTTGLPVYAVADGHVSRISVSPSGFGNALYIDHTNGTTSVYGHLNTFRDDIQEFVKNAQYDSESFRVNLMLSSDIFPLKKGDLIGKSGNTGSSAGPHLHFEIRNTLSEKPINPLKFGFPVKDNTPPKVFSLMIKPLSESSHVDYQQSKKNFSVENTGNKYRIKDNRIIPVSGKIGFAIRANDYFDETNNRCGIYSLTLKIDGETWFSFQHNEFSFDESRYINSHIVYDEFIDSKQKFQKTWIDPGNRLNIYTWVREMGVYNFNDGNIHPVKIELTDLNGNNSSLYFSVESKYIPLQGDEVGNSVPFRYDKENTFENNEIILHILKGALYNDLDFSYGKTQNPEKFYSDIHVIHKKQIPLHRSCPLKIKVNNSNPEIENKLLLVNVDTLTNKYFASGGEFKNGWVESQIRNFGNYAVAADTVPPRIVPLGIKNRETLTESNRIRFKISDDLSGIKSYEGRIDGSWALFAYDAKNNLITHYFDAERFELKKRHSFVLKVTDYKDNSTVYEASFWK